MTLFKLFLEFIGYYKSGAEDIPDPRDYKAEEKDPIEFKNPKYKRPFAPIYPQDQKRTNRCTAFSGAHCATIMARRKHKRSVTVEGSDVWAKQLEQGTAHEDKGDFIRSSAKAICRYGIKVKGMNVDFKPKEYYLAKKNIAEWEQRLMNGQPIMTGLKVGRPFTSIISWIWNGTKRGGGHAILIYDFDKEAEHFCCLNSWGRWGFRKQGTFFVKYSDIDKLFSGFVFSKD